MSEALLRTRQMVLDSSGITVSLQISAYYFYNHYAWFEMVHPDHYSIPFAEQWITTLYTDVDKHNIPFGTYNPETDVSVTRWTQEQTRCHLSTIISDTKFIVRPVGLADSQLGEGFRVAIDGIEETKLQAVAPGCSAAMQWIHWRHFFRQNDPRLSEIENHFATWRQESKKNK